MGAAPLEGTGVTMKRSASPILQRLAAFALLIASGVVTHAEEKAAVIVAIGAPGDAAYAGVFEKWAGHWERAAEAAGATCERIGGEGDAADSLTRLREAVATHGGKSAEPLWLVLMGHGTDDGKEPKFNLRGADLSVLELAEWLRPVQRPVVLVAGFSTSGAFLKPLSGPGRVIVCGTRSGRESNFARFAGYLAEAIADPATDLDKDGATSLLEAWLAAARQTADFYKDQGRIATEHSLLDDNGDGSGTPADWFQGLRAVKRARDNQPADGLRANQLHLIPSSADQALPPEAKARRDELERDLASLREAKGTMSEDDYLAKIEAILVQIARIYRGEIRTE